MQASTASDLTAFCFNSNTSGAFAVSFAWMQLFSFPVGAASIGGVDLVNADVSQHVLTLAKSSTLFLPALTLRANNTYVFQVSLTSSLVKSITTSLIAVRIVASPLVARVVGGDRSVWASSLAPDVIVDASASYDPDSPLGLPHNLFFLWSCTRLSGVPCFSDANTAMRMGQWTQSPQISLPSILFVSSGPDPFLFQVCCSHTLR